MMHTRVTEINELPDSGYKVKTPIRVEIRRDADGTYRASAPELGMWVDGLGRTEAEAVNDLRDAIIVQRDSVGRVSASQCSRYALLVKSDFEQLIVED